jgi:hypothetical protein
MNYKLYTLVDITNTNQYSSAPGREIAKWQEQNFNTLLHTLGLRSNIWYDQPPAAVEVRGRLVGFDTDDILRLWRFDWTTERDFLYKKEDDIIGLLKDDFYLVPYIGGLNEDMEQQYAVFNTFDPGRNIVFFKK